MNRQTWFVTGAASRLGADIVRQALAAGHQRRGHRRRPAGRAAPRRHVADERLLALPLDEVDACAVGAAVRAAVARFGGIDVLVHGAADCSPRREFDAPPPPRDFSATVRSLFNMTRGVLEAMREQCAGRIHHLVPAPGRRAARRCSRSPASARRWRRTWRRSASRCRPCRRSEALALLCPASGSDRDKRSKRSDPAGRRGTPLPPSSPPFRACGAATPATARAPPRCARATVGKREALALGAVERQRQHLAPRVDDHAVAQGAAAVLVVPPCAGART